MLMMSYAYSFPRILILRSCLVLAGRPLWHEVANPAKVSVKSVNNPGHVLGVLSTLCMK